jgi:hypothetical protein
MNSCLSQYELHELIEHKLAGLELFEEQLIKKIELAESWHEPIGVITYFLARIVENQYSENSNGRKVIDCIFCLPEVLYIEIQELDLKFITCLVKTLRNPGLTLEEELLDLNNNIMSHEYDKIIRY